MNIIVWTRCFVLGHKYGRKRKVRHHAQTRQTCTVCGYVDLQNMPTTEQDAQQRALPIGQSTYRPLKKTPQPSAEHADHLDPPWTKE